MAAQTGVRAEVSRFVTKTPDCSAGTAPTLRIAQQPSHGVLSVETTQVPVAFPAPDSQSVCGTYQAAAAVATYTSYAGFVGTDTLILSLLFPNGRTVPPVVPLVVSPATVRTVPNWVFVVQRGAKGEPPLNRGVRGPGGAAAPPMPSMNDDPSKGHVNAQRGVLTTVMEFNTKNLDCSVGDYPDVRVSSGPAHGSVELRHTLVDVPKNPAVSSHCPGQTLATTEVLYTAEPNFYGEDSIVLKANYPDHRWKRLSFIVEVQ